MKLVYVNGFKIRQNLDVEFGVMDTHSTNPSQYLPKFYIPVGQVWVDCKFKTEVDFLMQIEKTFFKNDGTPYSEQRKAMRQYFAKSGGKTPEFIISKTKLQGVSVNFVDGAIVRHFMDPEFIFGGHDLVYDYIPKNEVWIDELMDKREIKYVLLHETIERKLMAKGKTYESAHEFATAAEKEARRSDGALYPGDPGFAKLADKNEFLKQFILGSEAKSPASIKVDMAGSRHGR